ncbi:MAG: DUF362 domain-containing protein [Desulfovibrio sp.]|jgi:uncharacterized protein (DUF362 family)|nr:DUF362 domain-containing protein [Desulfovibrio sp.]
MKRRDFLKWQVAGLGLLGVNAPLLAVAEKVFDGPPLPDVAVAKGSPGPATRAAVNQIGGMTRFVKPGQKVVIKPNMSFARGPESAVNTHPEVIGELLVMCREAGAGKILVLDHVLQDPELCLGRSGIRDICNAFQPGICHNLAAESFFVEADLPQAAEMRTNAFMRDVLEADVIIAAPVAKSHSAAGVSLSLKGQMGLIYDRRVMHSRYDLSTSIVDLAERVKPHLAVIDATRVLATNGPGGPGNVIQPGEVIASADPVAADATAVTSYEWYGRKIQPRQVQHLRLAHQRKLGRMDIEALVTKRVTA